MQCVASAVSRDDLWALEAIIINQEGSLFPNGLNGNPGCHWKVGEPDGWCNVPSSSAKDPRGKLRQVKLRDKQRSFEARQDEAITRAHAAATIREARAILAPFVGRKG